MRSLALVVVVMTGGGCMSPVMTFGGKSSTQAQHETASRVTPPILDVEPTWTGAVRTAKIRVWADDDFRAQNVRWERAFQDELDYANTVLATQFGVRLEAEFASWHRHVPDATLDDSLEALAAQDRGDDVLTVVGLTSSETLASATFEKLGVANLSGRHLVMRGYADGDERKMFERAFPELRRDELEQLYQARRRHKTAAVLLHELGHNLGAPHRDEANTLMYPSYSDRSAAFDDASRAIILASVDRYLHRTPRAAPVANPSPTPLPTAGDHTTLVIVVDASGRDLVGGMVLDYKTLLGLFKLSFDDDHDTVIVVHGEPGAPQDSIDAVVKLANSVGLAHVSIQ